jgi:mevalonate kinase
MENNSDLLFSAHAHGKLLISGEYAILDGAWGLAVPRDRGQTLHIASTESADAYFLALDVHGNPWFEARIHPDTFGAEMPIGTTDSLERLIQVLIFARENGVNVSKKLTGIQAVFHLEFPANWGWGSSSTWIWLMAQWLGLNAFALNKHVFGGSGYDIAAAGTTDPFLFRLANQVPELKQVDWNPVFKDKLFLVHLGQKQDSRAGMTHYHHQKKNVKWEGFVEKVSGCTLNLLACTNLYDFQDLLQEHESIIRILIAQETVQNRLFSDYRQGVVKSLGAWGGDFVLVTGTTSEVHDYFGRHKKLLVLPF